MPLSCTRTSRPCWPASGSGDPMTAHATVALDSAALPMARASEWLRLAGRSSTTWHLREQPTERCGQGKSSCGVSEWAVMGEPRQPRSRPASRGARGVPASAVQRHVQTCPRRFRGSVVRTCGSPRFRGSVSTRLPPSSGPPETPRLVTRRAAFGTMGAADGVGGPSALATASAHGLPRLAHASVVEGSCPFESGPCRQPG